MNRLLSRRKESWLDRAVQESEQKKSPLEGLGKGQQDGNDDTPYSTYQTCPECGNLFSWNHKRCPRCGAKV